MRKSSWVLTPVLGTLIFAGLYMVATFFYPGGSQADKNAIGFSWANNYWCNLLNETAINGQPNAAKPIAMAGMMVLCFTLAFFWLLFPKLINMGCFAKLAIPLSGMIAMTTSLLLFTDIDHDLVTNLASFFGLMATVGTFAGLYEKKWRGLFSFGILNLLLVGLNNYLYYHPTLIAYLPIVQKISFVSFLAWVCSINIHLYLQSAWKSGIQDQNIRQA